MQSFCKTNWPKEDIGGKKLLKGDGLCSLPQVAIGNSFVILGESSFRMHPFHSKSTGGELVKIEMSTVYEFLIWDELDFWKGECRVLGEELNSKF